MTRPPGSASGPWRAPSHSPWSRPFARPAPQRHRSRCSPASPLPWAGPTSPGRSSSATASGLPDAVPAAASRNSLLGDLPVPVQDTSAHARVYDDAGPPGVSRSRRKACGFLLDGQHRRPEDVLRRSMAGLCAPLSTLHAPPYGDPRMTRGRRGSLLIAAEDFHLLSPAGLPAHPSTASIAEAVVSTYHDASQRGSAPPRGPVTETTSVSGRQEPRSQVNQSVTCRMSASEMFVVGNQAL